MSKLRILALITFLLIRFSAFAHAEQPALQLSGDTLFIADSTVVAKLSAKPDHEFKGKKRFVSAVLAFPFPFGFIGAHRVMLGCKPWVPVVYVATFGGCFGILPLIDFCVITFSKDISPYENNPNLIMWLK